MSVLKIDNVDIIPSLSPHKEFSLKSGDTVIAKVNIQEYGIDYAEQIYKILEKGFPYNNIIILDKDTELEIYRYENKKHMVTL